jgi:hypothetical protein
MERRDRVVYSFDQNTQSFDVHVLSSILPVYDVDWWILLTWSFEVIMERPFGIQKPYQQCKHCPRRKEI